MMASVLTGLLVTAFFASAAASGKSDAQTKPAEVKKVLVLELTGLGIQSDIIRNLERYLRTSIATIEGFQVISPVDLQIALQDPKHRSIAECGGGPDCALKAARLVSADLVVFGNITALGQAFSLNVRALDVERGREVARQRANLSGSRDLLIPEVRLAAYRLVAPQRIRGSLLIDIDVEGVEVEIDGKVVGTTPLTQPVEDLKPGAHLVVLKRPGFSAFKKELDIRPFEPTRLELTLEKQQKN